MTRNSIFQLDFLIKGPKYNIIMSKHFDFHNFFFFSQVTPRCAPNCSCIDAYVVVYCIDDRSSFDRAVDILYNLRKEEHNDSAIILVANKCELARSRLVSTEGTPSYQTSLSLLNFLNYRAFEEAFRKCGT